MKVFGLKGSSVRDVANLMVTLKPEWWDLSGAMGQLNGGEGWYLADEHGSVIGWLLCKCYRAYMTVEIECLGYEDAGQFKIGPVLQPLVDQCEEWARIQGYVNTRFTIGSHGLSCHGRRLGKPWDELKELQALDREEYDWFTSIGFVPSGILPDIYGPGYHGIMLLKRV
jgi:hypothetical protein